MTDIQILELFMGVMLGGFGVIFSILFLIIKEFFKHKRESNEWKLQHSVALARIEEILKKGK